MYIERKEFYNQIHDSWAEVPRFFYAQKKKYVWHDCREENGYTIVSFLPVEVPFCVNCGEHFDGTAYFYSF